MRNKVLLWTQLKNEQTLLFHSLYAIFVNGLLWPGKMKSGKTLNYNGKNGTLEKKGITNGDLKKTLKFKLAFFIHYNTFNQSDHMDTPKHNNTCILPCFPQRALPSAINQNNTHTCEYLHSVLSKPINTLITYTAVVVCIYKKIII